jgi:hypothetical protein
MFTVADVQIWRWSFPAEIVPTVDGEISPANPAIWPRMTEPREIGIQAAILMDAVMPNV